MIVIPQSGIQHFFNNTTGYGNVATGYYALRNSNPNSNSVSSISDYSGTVPGAVKINSSGHGLSAGATLGVAIAGTVNYNGVYTATYIDADNFYINHVFFTSESGWWSIDVQGRYNTAIGYQAGYSSTTGSDNILLGSQAGYNLTSGSNNILIGYNINAQSAIADNQLSIGNLIFATGGFGTGTTVGSGNVGIGTTTPSKTLTVYGNTLLQSETNATKAFDIQNSGGTSIFNVDSTHNWIGINKSPTATLDIDAASPSYVNDFESGVLSPFSSVSAKPWTVTSTYAYGGAYSAGIVLNQGDPANSILSLTKTLNSSGVISFYYKCSSDFSYDSSIFYIDGNTANTLCNGQTKDWTLASYAVSAGVHTFNWQLNHTSALIASGYFYVDNVEITNSGTGIAALFNGGNVGIGTTNPVATLAVNGNENLSGGLNITYPSGGGSTVGTPSYSNSNAYSFTPASNNLIAGMTGDPNPYGDPILTNGSIGTYTTSVGGEPAIYSNNSITYTLGNGANGSGYDITNINIYTGWDNSNRSNIDLSNFTYSTFSNPSTFVAIPNTAVSNACGTSHCVSWLTASGGVIATNVYAIRFNFPAQQNGYVGYKELEVVGVASPDAGGSGTAGNPALSFGSLGNTGLFFPSANILGFSTNGTERLRINSTGNVGIGTASPAGILDVRGGTATSGNGTSINMYAQNGFGTGNTNGGNIILMPGTANGSGTTGNVGIGTTNPTVPLQVNTASSLAGGLGTNGGTSSYGDWSNSTGYVFNSISIYAPNGGIAGNQIYSTSDQRLKENITPLNPDMVTAFFDNINPVSFQWISSQNPDNGFIAQDLVGKGFGYLVSEVPDSNMTEQTNADGVTSPAGRRFVVNYNSIVPILAAGIQKNNQQIVAIENQFSNVSLKTDINISTLSGLQNSVDSNLVIINGQFEKLGAKVDAQATTLATLQTSADSKIITDKLQAQIDELKLQNQKYGAFDQLIANISDIDNLIYRDSLGNLDLLGGKFEASEITAGVLTIKTVDLESPTIGSGTIKSGEISVTIKTKAVSTKSKIFVTISKSDKAVPIKTGGIKDGESFDVQINDSLLSDLDFNWWIVQDGK